MTGAHNRRRCERIAVGLLLALHAGLAFTSLRTKSLTFDEVAYLVAGASYWAYGDHRLNPEAGPLPQRWAALPLLGYAPPDRDDPAWARSDPWRLGNRWLYHSSLPTDRALVRARAMMVALSLAFALLVFAVSRSLWGVAGGLVSLAAYALSPSLLAHARLATSDLAAAGFLLAASWSVWRLAQQVTPGRVASAGLAVAALLLSKYSGLVILPVAGGIVAGAVGLRRGTRWRVVAGLRGRTTGCRRALPLASAGLAVLIVVYLLVWGAYGLRFAMSPGSGASGDGQPFRPWAQLVSAGGAQAVVIDAARGAHLLPEAFLYGWAHAVYAGQQRRSFLLGEHSLTGFRSFFPVLFGAKTSPALLVLLAVGVATCCAAARRRRGALAARASPLLVLIAVYGGAAIASRLNIGHRHLLPVELSLVVLLGAAGWRIARAGRLRRGLVAAALAFMAFEALRFWPDYLAYWSPLVGGPAQGYRIAVDSSLDWGQDLTRVGEELERRRERGESEPVYLAYFGSASPPHHGVDARRLTSYLTYDWNRPDPRPLTGGSYWVSATELQNLYTLAPGHWTRDYEWRYQLLRGLVHALLAAEDDATRAALARSVGGRAELERSVALYCDLRFARLAAFLRQREPDRRIGFSIHEYRLSDAQVREWLEGPPPPQRAHSGYEQDPALAELF